MDSEADQDNEVDKEVEGGLRIVEVQRDRPAPERNLPLILVIRERAMLLLVMRKDLNVSQEVEGESPTRTHTKSPRDLLFELELVREDVPLKRVGVVVV